MASGPQPPCERRLVPKSAPQLRRIARAAAKLCLGTLASRALGFVRMLLMAHYFGGRAAMDVFNIAFMIPNLFRRVLGEQAIEGSLLPTFKTLATRGQTREAWRAASAILNWLVLLLIAAAALCALFAPQIVSGVLAPGFAPDTAAEAGNLGRLMCPFMILIGLAAFCGSLLLAHGQTWAYGIAPTFFNVGWIATMILLHARLGVYSLGWGVLVGGTLQLVAAATALLIGKRRGLVEGGYSLSAGLSDEHALSAMRLAGPICLAALIARCASIVDRAIASFLDVGSVAALGYGMQLALVPFALFGLSVARAAFMPLTEQAAQHDAVGFRSSVRYAIRLGLLILVPLAIATMVFAHPLASLLQRGRFGPDETKMVARALFWYAPALVGMGMVSILSRAMQSLKDTRSPFRAARWALYANVLLSGLLALTPMKHGGIALATSVSMALQASLVFAALHTRLRSLATAEAT